MGRKVIIPNSNVVSSNYQNSLLNMLKAFHDKNNHTIITEYALIRNDIKTMTDFEVKCLVLCLQRVFYYSGKYVDGISSLEEMEYDGSHSLVDILLQMYNVEYYAKTNNLSLIMAEVKVLQHRLLLGQDYKRSYHLHHLIDTHHAINYSCDKFLQKIVRVENRDSKYLKALNYYCNKKYQQASEEISCIENHNKKEYILELLILDAQLDYKKITEKLKYSSLSNNTQEEEIIITYLLLKYNLDEASQLIFFRNKSHLLETLTDSYLTLNYFLMEGKDVFQTRLYFQESIEWVEKVLTLIRRLKLL